MNSPSWISLSSRLSTWTRPTKPMFPWSSWTPSTQMRTQVKSFASTLALVSKSTPSCRADTHASIRSLLHQFPEAAPLRKTLKREPLHFFQVGMSEGTSGQLGLTVNWDKAYQSSHSQIMEEMVSSTNITRAQALIHFRNSASFAYLPLTFLHRTNWDLKDNFILAMHTVLLSF